MSEESSEEAQTFELEAPLGDADLEGLEAGQRVRINGVIFGARDSAHRRMVEALDAGEPLPVDLAGQMIYYVGPSPAPPGHAIGSAGPTTSGRMDVFAPRLLECGLKAMIGKGSRSAEVREAMQKHKAVYLAVVGGAAALISRSIVEAEVVAYDDLGPEALRRLTVRGLPAVVINDVRGGDLYEQGRARYGKGSSS